MKKVTIVVILCFSATWLSGCASTITALTNRPITSDHLDEPEEANKLKTVSGDRRLVRVQKSEKFGWQVCAETQADAIAARGGSTTLTINGKGSGTDEATETLLLTNSRSETSDVVRQLAWHICNNYMNGAYGSDPTAYALRMDKLQHDAMAVLMAKAEKPNHQLLAQPVSKLTIGATFPELKPPSAEAPPAAKPSKP